MDALDADKTPLRSRKNELMCRDLVQFVPFQNFANQHYSAQAEAVVEELPRRLCGWAEMNGIQPTSFYNEIQTIEKMIRRSHIRSNLSH
jgi:hypothetical protein